LVEREKKTRTRVEKMIRRRMVCWRKVVVARERIVLRLRQATMRAAGAKRLQGKSQTRCRVQ